MTEKQKAGHSLGTTIAETPVNKGSQEGTAVPQTGALLPRLMDLHQAGDYTSTSYWTMRNLVDSGVLSKVVLPLSPRSNGKVLRRILVDRRDLDALIDANKETL